MNYSAKIVTHRQQLRIAVYFPNKKELKNRFKKLEGAQWSATMKCWHLPDTQENREKFKLLNSEHLIVKSEEKESADMLISKLADDKETIQQSPTSYQPSTIQNVFIQIKGKQIIIKLPKSDADTQYIKSFKYARWDKNNFVWIIPNWRNHLDMLSIYFDKRIKEIQFDEAEKEFENKNQSTNNFQFSKLPNFQIESHQKATEKMIELLRLENYSSNTINTYKNWFTLFLRYFPNHKPSTITKPEIMEMLLSFRNSPKWSATAQNQFISSIKFFFEKVLKRKREVYDLPRADRPYQLPTVFSESEIVAMFNACENFKHKTILMLAYSGGLRVSELVNLKLTDIDSKRMVITLRQAKGKKDRIVMLSEKLLLLFRTYFIEYKPKEYLFEGQNGGAYSSRSMEMIIKQAKYKAGIKKKGSIHALRHSFATHLLEGGTDIMSIKELLGHTNIQTTSIYTHVSKKTISKIQSPLDKLI